MRSVLGSVIGLGALAMGMLVAPGCGSSSSSDGASAGGATAGSTGGTSSTGATSGSSAGAGSAGGSSAGGGQGLTPGVDVPTNGPGFAGAGSAGAGDPISAGLGPESCGTSPSDAGPTFQVKGPDLAECYFINSDQAHPAAVVEHIVEAAANDDLVHIRLTLNPAFVDNTYGAGAIGWSGTDADAGTAAADAGADAGGTGKMGMMPPKPKPGGMGGHTFQDLVGSDHAEFVLTDAAGNVVLDFNLDYISVDPTKPSGYGSLGVSGGDGKVFTGNASDIVAASSSLDRNFNACGYSSYTTDSLSTDASYTPNPDAPNWDYRVVYDVWVKASAFGSAGFGAATISYVHASPSKTTSTLPVTPGPCPPPRTGCAGGATYEECPTGTPGGDAGTSTGDASAGDAGLPPSCGPVGASCGGGGDCCNGYCVDGVCGRLTCAKLGETCTRNADCCDDTAVCTSGQCTTFILVH